MRAVLAHDARQAKKGELQPEIGPSRDVHLFVGKVGADEASIESAGGANVMLEAVSKTGDELQDTHFRTATAHIADDVQNSQTIAGVARRAGKFGTRGDIPIQFDWGLHFQKFHKIFRAHQLPASR
jgi:hypothetical protein